MRKSFICRIGDSDTEPPLAALGMLHQMCGGSAREVRRTGDTGEVSADALECDCECHGESAGVPSSIRISVN